MPRHKKSKPYTRLPVASPLRHAFELVDRLRDEPRFGIVSAHSFLELLIDVLILESCKNGKQISNDTRTYPYSARLVILNEIGVIPDDLFQQLNYLRKLRNQCVHSATFELSEQHIERFKELGFDLVPDDAFEEGRMVWLLWGLIGATWNLRSELFTIRLMP